jgi:hypothetical protein
VGRKPTAGTVQAIDPTTNRTGPVISVNGTPQALATGKNAVWVTGIGSTVRAAAYAVAPGPGDVRLSACRKVIRAAGGAPDFLIVGDYPLSLPDSRNDSEAVAFVLREHAFRAGRYSVGYEACDDEGLGDDGRRDPCRPDARAYASAPRVIAVLAGYISTCALAQLPTLLAAGTIAMISPQNSADVLTSGRFPNYARVVPTDSDHTDADVGLPTTLGARHVFVVGEKGITYTEAVAHLFVERARGRIAIVGNELYDDNTAATTLAARIARSGADGIYLSGFPDPASGRLLQALRATLGPRPPIVAADGFKPVADAIRYAGAAATGIYVTSVRRWRPARWRRSRACNAVDAAELPISVKRASATCRPTRSHRPDASIG